MLHLANYHLLQYQARHKILTHSAFLCAIGAWLDVNMLTPRALRHILVGGLEQPWWPKPLPE